MTIPFEYAIYLSLIGIAFGFVLRSAMTFKRRHRNTEAPYHHFSGDPQPYEWRPDIADALRRKEAA